MREVIVRGMLEPKFVRQEMVMRGIARRHGRTRRIGRRVTRPRRTRFVSRVAAAVAAQV